ncbi:unnamed protein product [Ilex paraguariensis]|uniref:Uncharacterized protein n=1 Tax=Ilex paraguariensis TaxID=185542 RepID=A0ABC8UXI4_9AQUA
MVPEIALNGQDSPNCDIQGESGDSKALLLNEDSKALQADTKLSSSDLNNQVSEVSPVLGFQVKSDSFCIDSVSINEKSELNDNVIDNIIADDVKLELAVKHEMVPSSNDVFLDGGKSHPMDVEEPHENKVSAEETSDSNTKSADIGKKNDSGGVGPSEKLNLDRGSGEDSMEEDAMESKQIDSKLNSDEVGYRVEKIEGPIMVKEGTLDVIGDDLPADERNTDVES